ncbi:hypothetical protein [Chromobacterium paludis]|uniref:Uncharacterized protein n=1 Tax=Chromobacterium paludis TaxID=2605945 RepID=A0A5C1DIY5_9NEIS|nr:hypothetical protein [Chromobacterium paludis]QEL56696.1 hypothetical protein FYK34_14560 [Chromobacterium paludis]
MKSLLVLLAAAVCLGYYLILAWRPAWLAASLGGLPASIVLALAAMLLFCLIAAVYSRGERL